MSDLPADVEQVIGQAMRLVAAKLSGDDSTLFDEVSRLLEEILGHAVEESRLVELGNLLSVMAAVAAAWTGLLAEEGEIDNAEALYRLELEMRKQFGDQAV